jgi:hypothetical protein
MKLKTFLTINAIMFIPFGIGMLIMPSNIFPILSVNLDADGLVMASTVGSMLLSFGLICFFAKNEASNTVSIKAILIGNLSFHTIDFMLTGKGAFTGVMNQIGYVFSTMHFLFAVGFLYYIIQSKKIN